MELFLLRKDRAPRWGLPFVGQSRAGLALLDGESDRRESVCVVEYRVAGVRLDAERLGGIRGIDVPPEVPRQVGVAVEPGEESLLVEYPFVRRRIGNLADDAELPRDVHDAVRIGRYDLGFGSAELKRCRRESKRLLAGLDQAGAIRPDNPPDGRVQLVDLCLYWSHPVCVGGLEPRFVRLVLVVDALALGLEAKPPLRQSVQRGYYIGIDSHCVVTFLFYGKELVLL